MQTDPARQRRPQAVPQLMATRAARETIRRSALPLPPHVSRYLGQISLLHDLPFATLVPDSRMLPPESIRFFFLDQNWLDALVDGALSVADLTDQDRVLLDVLRSGIRDEVQAAAAARRNRRARSPQPGNRAAPPPATLLTGFLLRSSLVSDWPGLNVTAFAGEDGTQPLELRRLDRVAPSVLVVIVAGRAQQVRIAKPPQGLHYGVTQDGQRPGEYRVYLRGLGGKFPAGPQLPHDPYVPVRLRPTAAGRRVLDIAALQGEMSQGIATAYAPGPVPLVDPGAFGLELIAGAELQVFVPGPALAQGRRR